jgi:hypothetical protein
VASKPFYQVADRVLGGGFLRDIGEFFSLLQSMEAGFVAAGPTRWSVCSSIPGRAFVVVTTLEAAPAYRGPVPGQGVRRRGMHLGRGGDEPHPAHPGAGQARDRGVARLRAAARRPRRSPRPGGRGGAGRSGDGAGQCWWKWPIASTDIAVVATREAERRAELEALGAVAVVAPTFPYDVTDLAGLLELGATLIERELNGAIRDWPACAGLAHSATWRRSPSSHVYAARSPRPGRPPPATRGRMGVLADLGFGDLLLHAPPPTATWLVLAQVRPSTARTIYVADYVGETADSAPRHCSTPSWPPPPSSRATWRSTAARPHPGCGPSR